MTSRKSPIKRAAVRSGARTKPIAAKAAHTTKPTPKGGSKSLTQPRAVGPKPGSKIGTLVTMMRRKNGATIAQMCKSTGWQSHSVRGALAGAIKKQLGLKVSSVKVDGTRNYSITV